MPDDSGILSALKTGWENFNLGVAGIEDSVSGALGLNTHAAADYYTSDVNPESANFTPQLELAEDNGLIGQAATMTANDIASGAKSVFSFGKTALIVIAVIVGGIAVIYVVKTLKEIL